jgi:hypothetical protein
MKNVLIKKDCSGVTYEYSLINEENQEVLSGDGCDSVEEIVSFLKEWASIINSGNWSFVE